MKSVEENIEELSQNIFGKPSKDIKYLYVSNYVHEQLLEEEIARTGLYQWINVFRGDIRYPRDVIDYSDYDIVQINMSAQDIHLVQDIREKIGDNSKTKIVMNNDYTTEMWGGTFEFPNIISREIQGADMLFGTEYFQTTALTELSGRKCYVVPHPADVRRLKSLPPIPKKDILSTIWRRYDDFYYLPCLATRNHGLTTQLIVLEVKKFRKTFLATTLFDYVVAGTNYFDYCDQMRESKIVYDPFTFHSYSRATVDTAAMGVPVVGSNRTQSMNVCYPHTLVDPFDVTKARNLIRKLLDDEEFYKKVVDTALEKVEFYNHENSKERYLSALADALKIGRKRRVPTFKREKPTRGRGDDVNVITAKGLNRNEQEHQEEKGYKWKYSI